MAIRTVEMDFEFMNYIPSAPKKKEELYQQACSNDGITVSSWHDTWIKNCQDNNNIFGKFIDRGIGKLYNKFKNQPVILMGSGPSLSNNIEQLKDTKGIPIISCLHNFHYCVDNDIEVDYFVSLDAGEITIKEISEGGSKTEEEYFQATKDFTLLAFIGTSPRLLKKWLGEILFFNCPIPSPEIEKSFAEVEEFHTYVSAGGNVLGACTYIAKAILGCNPLCFVGADFAFSYTKQFHPWKSDYDVDVGNCMRAIDVFGNKVLTWPSYYNFKCWFDWLAQTVAGIYINCTEGGIMGAYPEGNIQSIQQMEIKQFLWMYSINESIKPQCDTPEENFKTILF